MATYEELSNIQGDPLYNILLQKIQVATAIKATAIIDTVTPAPSLLTWANGAISNTKKAGADIANYVIAKNAGSDIATIYAATDNAIQTNVDAAVDALYGS